MNIHIEIDPFGGPNKTKNIKDNTETWDMFFCSQAPFPLPSPETNKAPETGWLECDRFLSFSLSGATLVSGRVDVRKMIFPCSLALNPMQNILGVCNF